MHIYFIMTTLAASTTLFMFNFQHNLMQIEKNKISHLVQLNKWMCESEFTMCSAPLAPTGLHVGQFCPQKVCCHAKPCLHWGCSQVPPSSSPSSCSSSLPCLSTTQCQCLTREFGCNTLHYSLCDTVKIHQQTSAIHSYRDHSALVFKGIFTLGTWVCTQVCFFSVV